MLSYFAERRFLRHLVPIDSYTSVVETDFAGRSVVADREIEEGELIGIYPGLHLTLEEFAEKEEIQVRSVKACFRAHDGRVIDPTDIFGCIPNKPALRLALVNEPPPEKHVNVLPIISKRNVWYLCVRKILPNEHLFTTYGDSYERSYETAELVFEDSHAQCLASAAKRYPWIKKDIAVLLDTFK
jgi:hypothetical protein